eukprot:TRINITY_DN1260_c2_g2_i2.p1 TRINITY_DN1260_c2_g2~~TRINITY_DN1260_c2_g2_i2.p1  ORF type:complete len:319 (-),score=62.06 TRINITY_DN1260_c2_g2_i2:21-977(-)
MKSSSLKAFAGFILVVGALLYLTGQLSPLPSNGLVQNTIIVGEPVVDSKAGADKPKVQPEPEPEPELEPKSQPTPENVPEKKTIHYTYTVLATYPHNPESFTQGLEIFNGNLYEGTGLNDKSKLLLVDLETGKEIKSLRLPRAYFGEGITVFKEKIYQLTWRSRLGFIYDRETFEKTGMWTYPHEGWGLTHDDRFLIVSDGSNVIRYWDPETLEDTDFQVVREVHVKYADGKPATRLNELELIGGDIWANVWQQNKILIIDPETGFVKGIVDLQGLQQTNGKAHGDVLNGIAYSKSTESIYVTGKLWDTLYHIKINKQ